MDHSEEVGDTIDASAAIDAALQGERGLSDGTLLSGRYEIIEKLGEGGMGEVYKAYDSQLSQTMAIKLLKRQTSRNAVEKLKREAQVSMKLTHPNILRLINFEQDGDRSFLLMEYVAGKSLDEYCGDSVKERVGQENIARIGLKVCEALDYVHQKKIIHRDIKPSNIMVDHQGHVRLLDLGIARELVAERESQPAIAGTLAYLAPELFEGAPPDARSDIYALGLTLYELLARKHPFKEKGLTGRELIRRHLQDTPPDIEEVDRELMSLVKLCIEKKPNARYQTAAEMIVAFTRYLNIDEKVVVQRMKQEMEVEQRRLHLQKRDIERERKQLTSDRRKQRTERRSGPPTGKGYKVMPASSPARITLRVKTVAAALAGGTLAASLGVNSEDPLSVVTLVMLIVAPASIVRYGAVWGAVGLLASFVAGTAVPSVGGRLINFAYDNNFWTLYDMGPELTLTLSVAVAVGAMQALKEEFTTSQEALIPPLVAAVAVAYLMEQGFGGSFMGAMSGHLLEFPLLALLTWSATPAFQTLNHK